DRQRLRVRTAPHAAGAVAVEVQNISGRWRAPGAFLYVSPDAGPFAVDAIVPDRVPSSGGVPFLIGGNGFGPETQVRLDGNLVACTVERPQVLRCVPPAHAPGLVDVQVSDGDDVITRRDGLRFFAAIDLFDIAPRRGSIAGGTLVEVVGQGFTPGMRLIFEDDDLEVIDVDEFGERAVARTPPGRAGWVSLRGRTADDEALLPQAFEYFDPAMGRGGVYGDPIEHSVNVTVLEARSGVPVPGANVVVIGLGPRARWEGRTDEAGQVPISDPALELPVSVTASREGFTTTTYERIAAQNATLLLQSLTPPMPGAGEPRDPIPPVTLRGLLRGLDLLEKPDNEGYELVCFIEVSHTAPSNRLGNAPPAPNGILLEDGAFEVVVRPGEMAIVATAGYARTADRLAYEDEQLGYWAFRDRLQPIAMGLARHITASPGDTVEGLEVVLDRPTRRQVRVAIDHAPGGVRGAPNFYTVRPVLDLAAEGYWDFRMAYEGERPSGTLESLPDVGNWPELDVNLLWEGEALQTAPDEPYSYAYVYTYQRDVRREVRLAPMVATTQIDTPSEGGTLGAFRWVEFSTHPAFDGSPAEPADAHILRVTSNGSPIWMHVVPGAVTRIQFPQLPLLPGGESPGADLPEGELQLSVLSVIVDGGFDFEDFSYPDLFRTRSYSLSFVNFYR
ncbi:MAG: IPT/TIG domain-containing protein, partial [Myxococcales bacterium]|nr:IPT/TIG domain-containing protein [Myxococcales bacterium]